jgi:hypothetical protein
VFDRLGGEVVQEMVGDIRDTFIAKVVGGKTFAEVGGLWGTVSEKVSVAQSNGAKSLTMIDVTPINNDPNGLWQKFKERMGTFGIYEYQSMDQDICNFLHDSTCQQFDVVHCSGILYHHPHPFLILSALRKISRQYLVLTSAVTREVIQNEQGSYHLPPSAVMLVAQSEFAVQKSYWQKVTPSGAEGLTDRCRYTLDNYAPWWWLPTPSALVSMCEVVGFKVVDIGAYWGGNAVTLLLETVPEDEVFVEPGTISRSKLIEDKLQDLRRGLNEADGRSQGSENEEKERTEEVFRLKLELQQIRETVQELECRLSSEVNADEALAQAHRMIRAMESSKFWKLRTHWMKLKSKLSLGS